MREWTRQRREKEEVGGEEETAKTHCSS